MQAISTFCNAGFVFFDNDLPYAMVGDILFNINTAVLIVIGGFGYLAAFDIWSHRKVRRFVDLKLHTKIMLVIIKKYKSSVTKGGNSLHDTGIQCSLSNIGI